MTKNSVTKNVGGDPNVDAITADLYEDVSDHDGTLQRKIGWQGAFWVASGVPALVLFSMGAISATVGKPAWLIWMISIGFGFIQAFTYAEIAGLFPHKSGGASVYGAVAWVRYSKFIAPVSVWCNWFAWSPVLAIGSGLAGGYIMGALFAPDAVINTWQITLIDLNGLKEGLALRINATFIVGAALLLSVFAIQHGGILRSAKTTTILGLTALLPLMLIGVVPLITGDVMTENFFPLTPLAFDSVGNAIDGVWDLPGWSLMAGGLFIAAWSTYGFETAVCYTREFKNPKTDTYKAIIYSGILCIAVFTLVPIAFQGHLGLEGMLAPDIYSGMGVASVLSHMLGDSAVIANILVVMFVLALLLSIMTSMAGSSRTLYQASVDGWLPKYLSHVNEHGAPTRAMWTDLVFNLGLLMMSDYVFILAISNVGYIIFNFLNLNSGWIHRMDRPNWNRPYKAPFVLLAAGGVLAYVNLMLMGLGANIWGEGTLMTGLLFATLIIPVFMYRHYVQDKGVFPKQMLDDMHLASEDEGVSSRAGMLPYVALLAGVFVVYYSHSLVS